MRIEIGKRQDDRKQDQIVKGFKNTKADDTPSIKQILQKVHFYKRKRQAKRSHDAYHKELGLALGLLYSVRASKHPKAEIAKLAEDSPFKVTAKTPGSLIVVRAVVNYETSKGMRRKEERRASRDAAAIEHLFARGVAPDEVVELGSKHGEGVESWARAKSVQKNVKAGSAAGSSGIRASSKNCVGKKTAVNVPPARKMAAARKGAIKPAVITPLKLGAKINKRYPSIRLAMKKGVLWSPGSLATLTVEVMDTSPLTKPKAAFKALVAAVDARLAAIADDLGVAVPRRDA